jgi:tetratricopeptide (TPR) repeat protein
MDAAAPGGDRRRGGAADGGSVSQVVTASGYSQVNVAGGDQIVTHQTVLPASASRPMREVDAPAGLVNLPYRTQTFVGRADELSRLEEALKPGGKIVVQAVHGLGGIGKSALAAKWAASHAEEHSLTWWITADGRASVEQGLVSLAVALQPELAGLHPRGLIERAVQWLECHVGWLLVLDNVQHPDDIGWLVSRLEAGRILVTTRIRPASGWDAVRLSPIRLDVLSDGEALELLARIAQDPEVAAPGIKLDGGAELCAHLGNLPLAIEQTAAYIRNLSMSPHRYLELLQSAPAVMYEQAAEGSDSARTIARIWRVTLDRLADTPLAGQLLRILAWFGHSDFPRAIVQELPDPARIEHAIGRLAAYNMITLTQNGSAIAVHRLVQAVARTADPADPHRQPDDIKRDRNVATHMLSAAFPKDIDDPATWPTCRVVLPHAVALAQNAPPDTDTGDTVHLLNQLGRFLRDQGAPGRAIPYHQRAYDTAVRDLGEDHPVALSVLGHLAAAHKAAGNVQLAITLLKKIVAGFQQHDDYQLASLRWQSDLASAYLAAGDIRRAIDLHSRVLDDRREILGEDDEVVRQSLHHLALACRHAGEISRAIPLLQQALDDERCKSGTDHPDTLACQLNLAQAYLEAGDLDQAIPLFQQTAEDCQRVMGADYPVTLVARLELASATHKAGYLDQSIAMHENILADARRVLGPDHPYILGAQNNLAFAYKATKKYDRAIPLYRETLASSLRIHGKDHPTTLGCRANLATAYEFSDDLARAIPLFKKALAECRRVLGDDHPLTLDCENNLAHAYQTAGQLTQALPIFEEHLARSRRVLGDNHPDTLSAWNNLAFIYELTGKLTEAIALHEQTLARRRQLLSTDHPDITQSTVNLAGAYESAGQYDRAIVLRKQVLAWRSRTLGEHHPETLGSKTNLAYAHLSAGDLKQAISLLKQNLAELTRVLGEDHDLTRQARVWLVISYVAADKLGGAIPLLEQSLVKHIKADSSSASLLEKVRLAQTRYAAGDYTQARTSIAEILSELADTDSSRPRNSEMRAIAVELHSSQEPLFTAHQKLTGSKRNSDIQADHAPITGTSW